MTFRSGFADEIIAWKTTDLLKIVPFFSWESDSDSIFGQFYRGKKSMP